MLLPDRNKNSFLEIRFADRNKKRSTRNMKIMKKTVVGFNISSNRFVLLNNPFHPSIDFGVYVYVCEGEESESGEPNRVTG